MSLVPLVKQYANAPASLRSSGVAVISIERVVAQAKFRIATKRRKAMSRRDYRCRQAFRHFMNLLNRAVYGAAFRRYGKRLRVLPVLERGEVHARALRSWERGTSGRWHIHCAIELPSHCDAVALERLIRNCWAKVEWGSGRILVRDGANAGWINYMLKNRQKSEFDGFLDCIIIESLHNPVADA
jgi:hypothetical protein